MPKALVESKKASQTQRKASRTKRKASGTQDKPHRKAVESSLHSECEGLVRVGHIYFMLFVSFLFRLGTQHKPGFW